jgi:hypothetical protein
MNGPYITIIEFGTTQDRLLVAETTILHTLMKLMSLAQEYTVPAPVNA